CAGASTGGWYFDVW
nr:immunoglobulin heavy chain junction region [Mus musculus]